MRRMKLPAASRGVSPVRLSGPSKSAIAQPAFAKATAGPRHSSPPQDGGVFWRRRIKFLVILLIALAPITWAFPSCGGPELLQIPAPGDGDDGDGDKDEDPSENDPTDGTDTDNSPIGNPDDASVSFVAFGDWGSGSDEQWEVASALEGYCAENPCEFLVTLGDNFYSDGVDSVEDPLWQERYSDVYGSLGIPFYASLGNHDNNGNIQAQIDYSDEDPAWHMPGEYYAFAAPNPSEAPLVEFFIFNSDYPHFRDEAVQAWMDEAIGASNAVWKILVMHHPVYSNGNHGDDDQGNNEFLLPIICNRIDLVLSGHDHSFEYLRSSEDDCPIEQLVIGTGGAGLREVDLDERTIASAITHGFGWFQITADSITFRMIDTNEEAVTSTTWDR